MGITVEVYGKNNENGIYPLGNIFVENIEGDQCLVIMNHFPPSNDNGVDVCVGVFTDVPKDVSIDFEVGSCILYSQIYEHLDEYNNAVYDRLLVLRINSIIRKGSTKYIVTQEGLELTRDMDSLSPLLG